MRSDEDEVPPPPEGDDGAGGDEGRGERLHKFLAATGAGSRRECETFIAQGRVAVNGKVVTKMGVKVDPEQDVVTLDGERVRRQGVVYYLLHKPAGYICTNSDERGRPRVVDLVQREDKRIYTVGRLDADSTGLILLTNDGEIANIVCHPRYRIEKRYQVVVRGHVTRAQVARVTAGVWLAEGKSSPADVKPVGFNPKRNETVLEMSLFEGRNREIRRVFGRVGLQVRRLRRAAIGPLELGDLPAGSYRRLEPEDLRFVRAAERLYLANKEAWDAELPPEDRRPLPRKATRPGGRASSRGAASGGGRRPDRGSFPRRGRRRSGEGPAGPPGAGGPGGEGPGPRRRRPLDDGPRGRR